MAEEYSKPTLYSIDEGDGAITPTGVIVAFLVLVAVYTVAGGVTIVAAGGAWAIAMGATATEVTYT